MKSLRSFFLTLAGLTFVAVAALFTASLGLAIAGAVSVLVLGQWLSAFLNEKPPQVRAYARANQAAVVVPFILGGAMGPVTN
eukprot:gene16789-22268_t